MVIGVASATTNIWIIFLSGFAAILAGAFSMAGGEYVSVSTPKDTEEAAVSREKLLLDQDRELAKKSLYAAYIQNGECKTSAQLLTNKIFLKPQLFTPNLKTIQNPCLSLDPGWFLFHPMGVFY